MGPVHLPLRRVNIQLSLLWDSIPWPIKFRLEHLGMIAHICYHWTWEPKARELRTLGQPGLHSKKQERGRVGQINCICYIFISLYHHLLHKVYFSSFLLILALQSLERTKPKFITKFHLTNLVIVIGIHLSSSTKKMTKVIRIPILQLISYN